MAADKQQILQFIKANGPVLPTDLSRQFKQDTMIIGALLSELAKSKDIIVSNVKVGGSPLYLVKEQSAKLTDYADHLNEKDKEAHDLLKEKKILHDRSLTPLLRVSLRQIKDFARPVHVEINGEEELFWRWYMTSLSDVEEKIRDRLSPKRTSEEAQGQDQESKASPTFNQESQVSRASERSQPSQPSQIDQKNSQTISKEKSSTENSKEGDTKGYREEPRIGAKEENKQRKENKEKIENEIAEPLEQKSNMDIKEAKTAHHIENNNDEGEFEDQKQKTLPIDAAISDDFHAEVKKYFTGKRINIRYVSVLRKNSEIEYVVDVPSSLGPLGYYCRAKTKKKINEADLASAFVGSQKKKLPVLFLTTGTLTKKAQEALSIDFPGMRVFNIQ